MKDRKCQVLIDKDPSVEHNGLDELSEKELVTKANEAVRLLKDLHSDKEVSFLGEKQLLNSGIIYKMNTKSAAKWVCKNHKEFLGKFSTTSIIKDHSTTVIIKYVPTRYNPDAPAKIKAVE